MGAIALGVVSPGCTAEADAMSRSPTQRRRSEAFTLIEVMTSVALLTVSASGILLMQGATSSANQQAHESSVATDFAQTWVERLKRDSLRWTQIGEADRTDDPIYINGALSDVGQDNWLTPAFVLANNESNAADAFGFDVNPADAARVRFCMNYRNVVQHVAPHPTTLLPDTDTLRVDVRVWWIRRGDRRDLMVPAGASQCDVMPAQSDFQSMLARVVYVSTVLRWEAP